MSLTKFPATILLLAPVLFVLSCASGPLGNLVESGTEPDASLQDGEINSGEGLGCSDSDASGFPSRLPQELCYPGASPVDIENTSLARLQREVIESVLTDEVEEVAVAAVEASDVFVWNAEVTRSGLQDFYETVFSGNEWEVVPLSSSRGSTLLWAEKNGVTIVLDFQLDSAVSEQLPEQEEEGGSGLFSVSRSGDDSDVLPYALLYVSQSLIAESGDGLTSSGDDDGEGDESDGSARVGASLAQNDTDLEDEDTEVVEQTAGRIVQIPPELQVYVSDVLALDVLANDAQKPVASDLSLDTVITRREYVRWLFAMYNFLHSDRPDLQVRSPVPSSEPLFADVSAEDPDFSAIQGLAEAGILPSSLTDETAIQFQPGSPLVREDLIVWKTLLDQANAPISAAVTPNDIAAIFQDGDRISAEALGLITADYQNQNASNIRRAFGYTRLFQPEKHVTRAEAIATLWQFGQQDSAVTAKDALD